MSRSPSRASSSGKPQPVGDVLARFLDRAGLSAKVEAASALTDWAPRVGPQIAAVTRALRVSEGTLFVAVSTSAWLMELNLMKGDLMRHLNAGKSDGKVRQIVFVMAGGAGGDGAGRETGESARKRAP